MTAHTDVDISTQSDEMNPGRRRMRATILTIATAAALALAACGGSGDAPLSPDNSGGTRPPAPDAPGDVGVPGDDTAAPPDDGPGAIEPPPVAGDEVQLPPVFAVGSPLLGSGVSVDTFPRHQIVSGGVAKDGIPALTNPFFIEAGAVTYLADNDLVLGLVVNGEARAYPHNIGWWHEIVNDVIGGEPVCVTLCPLTGTGLVFDTAAENGEPFELGVSGLLFNNNLVMYDRRDGNTLYPQIFSTAVDGPRKGESLTLLPVVETNWSTWQRLYPDTRVIASGTYNVSQYTRYPYGNYRTNNDFLIFGLNPPLTTNPSFFATARGSKDMVLGVRMAGESRAYPFDAMGAQAVINDELGGVDIVVAWDRDSNIALPFAREVAGQSLTFDIDENGAWPVGFRDRETDTLWNIKGEALEGPLSGQRLTQIPAHNSMWFAWVTFWQDTDVWQQ